MAPPIVDAEGRTWLASMHFDLLPMKRRSVRLIVDLVLSVVAGSAVFSLVIFLVVRHALVIPIRELTREIERLAASGFAGEASVDLPRFDSAEMDSLAQAVEAACRARRAESDALGPGLEPG